MQKKTSFYNNEGVIIIKSKKQLKLNKLLSVLQKYKKILKMYYTR
jgi:hypothetical protein